MAAPAPPRDVVRVLQEEAVARSLNRSGTVDGVSAAGWAWRFERSLESRLVVCVAHTAEIAQLLESGSLDDALSLRITNLSHWCALFDGFQDVLMGALLEWRHPAPHRHGVSPTVLMRRWAEQDILRGRLALDLTEIKPPTNSQFTWRARMLARTAECLASAPIARWPGAGWVGPDAGFKFGDNPNELLIYGQDAQLDRRLVLPPGSVNCREGEMVELEGGRLVARTAWTADGTSIARTVFDRRGAPVLTVVDAPSSVSQGPDGFPDWGVLPSFDIIPYSAVITIAIEDMGTIARTDEGLWGFFASAPDLFVALSFSDGTTVSSVQTAVAWNQHHPRPRNSSFVFEATLESQLTIDLMDADLGGAELVMRSVIDGIPASGSIDFADGSSWISATVVRDAIPNFAFYEERFFRDPRERPPLILSLSEEAERLDLEAARNDWRHALAATLASSLVEATFSFVVQALLRGL